MTPPPKINNKSDTKRVMKTQSCGYFCLSLGVISVRKPKCMFLDSNNQRYNICGRVHTSTICPSDLPAASLAVFAPAYRYRKNLWYDTKMVEIVSISMKVNFDVYPHNNCAWCYILPLLPLLLLFLLLLQQNRSATKDLRASSRIQFNFCLPFCFSIAFLNIYIFKSPSHCKLSNKNVF